MIGVAKKSVDNCPMVWYHQSRAEQQVSNFHTSASGGIGRLAGFRCQCSQGRAGSTPASRTTRKPRNHSGSGVFFSSFHIVFPLFFPYGLEILLMYCSIRSALACFICSVTWPYTSRVKAAVWWPKFSWTVLMSSPLWSAATA